MLLCSPSGLSYMARTPTFLLAIWLALGALTALPSVAQDTETATQPSPSAQASGRHAAPVAGTGADWMQRLDAIERFLESGQVPSPTLREALRDVITKINEEAEATLKRNTERLPPLRSELESLGPAPGEQDPPEPEAIADLRQQLLDRIGRVETRITEARLAKVRGENYWNRINLDKSSSIQDRLWTRSPSLFSAGTWDKGLSDFGLLFRSLGKSPESWWDTEGRDWHPMSILAIVLFSLVAALLAIPARSKLQARFGRREEEERPSFARRIAAAVISALSDIILPVAALATLAATIRVFQEDPAGFLAVITNACIGLMVFFTISGLAKAALAPESPEWRIVPVTEDGAVVLSRRIAVIAIFTGAIIFLDTEARGEGINSPEFVAVGSIFADTILAGLLLTLIPAQYWEHAEDKAGDFAWTAIRALVGIFLISTPFVVLAGYAMLADFLLARLVLTVVVVGAAFLVRVALGEALAQAFITPGRLNSVMHGWLRLPQASATLVTFWIGVLIDIAIFLPLLYLLLVTYGFPPVLINIWVTGILKGFEVGNVTISPSDILLALLALVVGLIITGWIRRSLGNKLQTYTRLDLGVRNSIVSGVGYTGIVISIVFAIAMLGLDLSNLALVAGALSVGVGFGLRTIVENFVSGLLLLIERPIKAGDWIVAAGYEGTVKRISVRSTEIETFDRAAVIVPNSELISQPVQNWTHKNRLARILVPVGVAYGSNVEKVRDLLLDCAQKSEHVLSYPEPYVLFKAFGESSLDFELRCYVPDTDYFLTSKSDLLFAIDAAFRDHAIEIPFPQRDLHVRSVPPEVAGDTAKDSDGTAE